MKDTETYSPRSQRSLLRQHELQLQLDKAEANVQRYQRRIAELEESKKRVLASMSKPGGGHPGLSQTLRGDNDGLAEARELLAFNENACAGLRSEIERLNLSPAESKARAEQQQLLVSLLSERMEKDREAEKALVEFRRILQERAELSARMAECASAIQFRAGDDSLDTRRFEQLALSLPDEIAASSEKWGACFLGNRTGVGIYVVRDELLIVPETLANHGVYRQADKVELFEEEARELLREDRSAPAADAPWRVAAPSIVTLEAYEDAVARAKANELSVQDIWAGEDLARERQAREAHILRLQGRPGEPGEGVFSSISEAMRD